jgi:hypothetical protein
VMGNGCERYMHFILSLIVAVCEHYGFFSERACP